MSITKLDLERSFERTKFFRKHTPLLSKTFLDELWSCEVFIKCEQFQDIGAFKIRGASNFALRLSNTEIKSGFVTHSSGNHAQAVAYMAHRLKTKSFIVMPENANKKKVENAIKWGAEVSFCKPTIEDRINTAWDLSEKHNATIIPPFDHEWIVEGQASCVMELLTQQPSIDVIITPLGGGGLLAGSSLAAHYFSPETEVWGAEPANAADGYEGLKKGERITAIDSNTVADGLRTFVGEVPFDIIKTYVNQVYLADEEDILPWMYRLWSETKTLIEPSCAVPFAALHKIRKQLKGKRIAIIVTGGNVDLNQFVSS
ncbi:MAG: threonine/serine dehydratase [Salibacteraceae bacterium]